MEDRSGMNRRDFLCKATVAAALTAAPAVSGSWVAHAEQKVVAASSHELKDQAPTRTSLEQHVRDVYAAWASKDPVKVAALDTSAPGFGYRTQAARPAFTSNAAYIAFLNSFFASLKYYSLVIDELYLDVNGDVGLVWGFTLRNTRCWENRRKKCV
jgi:CO/xanthine dehydrogenase Mo-binding subunit